MIKGSIYQKVIILNIYVPNNNPFKLHKVKKKKIHKATYTKVKLKGEIDKCKILARDFKNHLSVIHRTVGKINLEIEDLNLSIILVPVADAC